MKAKIIKITRRLSTWGGEFFFAFFKLEDGKSARSCLYPSMANYQRWRPFVQRALKGEEVWLDGLRFKKPGMIDADSTFTEAKQAEAA